MRNALYKFLSTASRHVSPSARRKRLSIGDFRDEQFLGGRRNVGLRSFEFIIRSVPRDGYSMLHYSTGFTSVHGNRPSAEYAKRRKESLETEFGTTLGTYRSKTLFAYYRFGPFLAIYRATIISFQVAKLTVWHIFLQDIRKRAEKFRETLVRLGPFYIKLGQVLSTRPDILPSVYCQELSKLQDQIPPFSTNIAIGLIESQLGAPISKIFSEISEEPVASASLGQVYKAQLHSGDTVAVKVQRPGMPLMLTLDALLFHMIGGQLKRFAKAQKDLFVAVNEMVRHMFAEIDYILEAENAERFSSLFASDGQNGQKIKVPKIYWEFTRKTVLTMEWIDGIKLTDSHRISEASLNRKELIDQGVYCSLRQIIEEGYFHGDPHPGNLLAISDGSLAYIDYGMMGDIPRHYRVGLIQVLVHFVNRDSWGLANDFLSLGFIPDGADIKAIADALQASFGDSARHSTDFQAIMNQLYDVMYEFNFSLPPDYALVVRALGSLEGTAKALDPEFKVVESAYPFVIGRLLSDPSPDMRQILRELLIRNDGSIRWHRLKRLIAAISEQASDAGGEWNDGSAGISAAASWRSFDMRAVVSATEDLLLFIFSKKGRRVRVFLIRDIIQAIDSSLDDISKSNPHDGEFPAARAVNGMRSLWTAVKSTPEAWAGMLLRISTRPELHRFVADVASALGTHSQKRFRETFWHQLSNILHKVTQNR
ncbi:protein kinase superfamily protein [Wolffia australiana]